MKSKYWAKKTYRKFDPVKYDQDRFVGPAGGMIDEVEKEAVLDLLCSYFPQVRKRKKSLKVLNVACGTGRLTVFLKEKLQKADITGLDINSNMLSLAIDKAKKGKKKIKFLVGDIYNLPFADSKFDALVGLRFSMHLPRMEKVLKELSRVIKKEGVVVFDIFNLDSLLRLGMFGRLPKVNLIYKLEEISKKASRAGLRLEDKKGVLLLGESVLRKCPEDLLPLLSFSLRPPIYFSGLATKLVLSFKKIK